MSLPCLGLQIIWIRILCSSKRRIGALYQLSKKFIGYGHYELTISSSEGTKTIVTGSMDLIERLNSEIDKEKEEATAEAIALVLKSSL